MISNLSESKETALFYGTVKSSSDKSSSPSETKKQFLRLHLTRETIALLPTKQLAEVLTLDSQQIAPMPHMSPQIMGTHNWRGKILWLVDLGYLMGFKPLSYQVFDSTYTAVVWQFSSDRNEDLFVGLVVERVGSIERFSAKSIQPPSPSTIDTKLTKFLRGYWFKSESEVLSVLEPDIILNEIRA